MSAPDPVSIQPLGATLLIGSSWAALCLYAWSVSRLAWETGPTPWPRLLWTAGCLCFGLHVIAAFDTVYGWSHRNAVADVANQSESLSGVRAPWGIYVNYAFGIVWLLDAAWWWMAGDAAYRRRGRISHWAVHGFFLFMVFNGGFVFVERWTRWFGLALFALGLVAVIRVSARRRDSRTASAP